MKSLSAPILTALEGDELTFCTCAKITTTQSPQVVTGFTSLDVDLTISGVTYSSMEGYGHTDFQYSTGLAIDNLDLAGLLASAGITDADIQAGVYDYAEINFFMVNYESTSQIIPLSSGHVGEIKTAEAFMAEVRSLAQLMSQTIGNKITADCRHDLGDTNCGVALAGFTSTGTITSQSGDRVNFADTSRTESSTYFKYGLLTWTSGNNAGYSMEVKTYTLGGSPQAGSFELFLPMPYDIQVGDGYSVYAGCDKFKATCKNVFNNLVNFGGFPHCPTQNAIAKPGGQ